MAFTIAEITKILDGRGQIVSPDVSIRQLLTDSRNVSFGAESLFFAIPGKQHDGHAYIGQAAAAGVRCFVVERMPQKPDPEANFILVPNVIEALQRLAAAHRRQFDIPVVGITGSNGKTIVKEWLNHLLQPHLDIVRSPRSYNSQIGVPLSVWEMDARHELGIFEAGISRPDEMEHLQTIIQPTIGIMTNIGSPHSEGFTNDIEKLREKLRLFDSCKTIIYCADQPSVHAEISKTEKGFSWSQLHDNAEVRVRDVHVEGDVTTFHLQFQSHLLHMQIPFSDAAAIENAIHALVTALFILSEHKRLDIRTIVSLQAQSACLPVISMRLELKRGNQNCLIINDTYSADLASLEIALRFQAQHGAGLNSSIIFAEFDQTGLSDTALCNSLAQLFNRYQIKRAFAIGELYAKHQALFDGIDIQFVSDTDAFLRLFKQSAFNKEIILIKGARRFALERISNMLEAKTHGTVLRIHMHHLVHNLHVYRSTLKPGVKTMVMVKAFSYGSGQAEIARILSHQRVDYLAVAYADEGIELRAQGIRLPIMVMNPEPDTFASMITHQLEPELYNQRILEAWLQEAAQVAEPPAVHIKIDTGMHRLGFEPQELDVVLSHISKMRIASVFTHLSAADDKLHDAFTREQILAFSQAASRIQQAVNYPILLHALNSSGISHYPDAQFDMVRLGIGLYGVDPADAIQSQLKPVSTFETSISQIKEIAAGESVGYSRSFIAEKPMRIATINLGYADGFSRVLSNGRGMVAIIPADGKFNQQYICPVVGRVCMDMTMIDITHVPEAQEGDIVEIFGTHISIQSHAAMRNTIAYEVMTGISQRVKRVYESEG